MKLVSYNIAHGLNAVEILDFVEKHMWTTFGFLFQEVPHEMFRELNHFMPFHMGVTSSMGDSQYNEDYELAIFIPKDFPVRSVHTGFTSSGNVLALELEAAERRILLCNIHGPARPGTKLDTGQRRQFSGDVLRFIGNFDCPKVVAGDFNMLPGIESLQVLEAGGLRNLITENKISRTRNVVGLRQVRERCLNRGELFTPQRYADFTFISPELRCKSFEVPYAKGSDHLPMVMDLLI